MNTTAALKEISLDTLRESLTPGATVWVTYTKINASSRDMRIFIIEGQELTSITAHVARALDYRLVDDGGYFHLRAKGGGEDLRYSVVMNLGRVLFNDLYSLTVRTF